MKNNAKLPSSGATDHTRSKKARRANRLHLATKAAPKKITQDAEVDFTVADVGTVVYFTPVTAKARQVCEDGTIVFEDWQQRDGSIAVHHSCAVHLIENLRDAGFVIANR